MVKCPHGHPNPTGWQLCGECGSQIEETASGSGGRWYRTKWALLGASVLATLAIAGAVVAVIDRSPDRAGSSEPTTSGENVAILEWWSKAREPFTDLQQSLKDAQQALAGVDRAGMQEACQQMHDTAAVDLQAQLPAPTPNLDSEVSAAAEDAHDASHMCMSVLSGSMNSYDGEFTASVDQAQKHLTAAQELVQQALVNTP